MAVSEGLRSAAGSSSQGVPSTEAALLGEGTAIPHPLRLPCEQQQLFHPLPLALACARLTGCTVSVGNGSNEPQLSSSPYSHG